MPPNNAKVALFSRTTSRSRRSRLKRLVNLLLVLTYLVFALGKPLYLPIGIAVSSTENNRVRLLDLAVIAPQYVSRPLSGDLVLACLPGYWNTACTLGLYVVNGANGVAGVVAISGDPGNLSESALQTPNPISAYSGVFRVLLVVRREVWIPLLTGFYAYLGYALVKHLRAKYHKALGESASLAPAMAIIVLFNVFVVGSTYIDHATAIYTLPSVNVQADFSLDNSTMLLRIETKGHYALLGANCTVKLDLVGGGAGSAALSAPTSLVNGSAVLVEIPVEVYEALYSARKIPPDIPLVPEYLRVSEVVPVSCSLHFDKFWLQYTHVAEFEWRDLDLDYREGRLLLTNRNPVGINATVTAIDAERGVVVYRGTVVLGRLSTHELTLEQAAYGRLIVTVTYEHLGLKRNRVLQVGS